MLIWDQRFWAWQFGTQGAAVKRQQICFAYESEEEVAARDFVAKPDSASSGCSVPKGGDGSKGGG